MFVLHYYFVNVFHKFVKGCIGLYYILELSSLTYTYRLLGLMFLFDQIGSSVFSNVIGAENVRFFRLVVSCDHFLMAMECSWSSNSS